MIALLALGPGAHAEMDLFAAYYNNVARAAAANDAATVARLVAGDGYKANSVDDSGRTGLQIAATNGNLQIAAILIKAGANVNQKDRLGNTALHVATERNQTEMAELLIDVGADLNSENKNGMTPLMMAARAGQCRILSRRCSRKGADVRKTDFTGRDAVSWAQESRRPAVVQALQRPPSQRAEPRRYAMPEPEPPRLDEIRGLLAHLPGPDLDAGTRRGDARAPADETGRRARPARGAGGMARDLAGPPSAARSTTRARSCSPATTGSPRAASRPIRPRSRRRWCRTSSPAAPR